MPRRRPECCERGRFKPVLRRLGGDRGVAGHMRVPMPVRRRDYGVRSQVSQATKVSWFAVALVAGAARQLADVDRLGDAGGITPWGRATRQRGPIDVHDPVRASSRHVQGPAVAADEEGGARDPGPQLGEVEVVAVDHRLGPRAEPRPGGVPDAAGRGGIRRSDTTTRRRVSSAAASDEARSTKHSSGQRRNRLPALTWSTTIWCSWPMRTAARRRLTRATAAGSSGISTGSSYGSAGSRRGHPALRASPTDSRPRDAACAAEPRAACIPSRARASHSRFARERGLPT